MPIHETSQQRPDVPPGTLELLILRCITGDPQHGYAISHAIKQRSEGTLLVEEGSLYPALHRLVRLKHVSAEWGASENNRRARYYRITPAGRRRLAHGTSTWKRVSGAVTAVLDGPSPEPHTGSVECAG